VASAGVLSGACDQRPFSRQNGLVALESNLVKVPRAQVPVDAPGPDYSKGLETVRPLNLCAHFLNSPLGGKRANNKKEIVLYSWSRVKDRAVPAVFHD